MTTPIADLIDLNGQTAVVTGGGRGIGRAIACRLAEAGASVIISDIDAEAAERTANSVGGVAVQADASEPESHERVVEAAIGVIDIWVNNAGVLPGNERIDEAEWDRMLGIDLKSVYFASMAAARRMDTGVIVNIASTTGLRGYPGMAHYVAAKHGVVGLTRALAADLAPRIRVLGIAPTLVDTEGMMAKREAIIAAGGDDPAPGVQARIPLGRLAIPDDIARVVLFCVSGLASYMTGQTIPVDGGRLAVEV